MTTSRWIQIGTVLGAIVFVTISSAYQRGINNDRQNLELIFNEDLRKNLSPDIAWRTAMLGSFRGLLVNMLWVRIERLKEEGKYFEAKGLAEEICKLQPRFPPVWVFHSWNMAWNISVATHTPEQRWKWVYNGVRLIRDRGIVYNPRSNWLYRQIAWIFFNKMGEWTDDMHRSYKRYWAMRMQRVLGPRMPDATRERVLAQFKVIADAPETVEQFIAMEAGNDALVKEVRRLGLPLDDGITLNESRPEAVGPLAAVDQFLDLYWAAVATGPTMADLAEGPGEQVNPYVQAMRSFLDGIEPAERRERLVAFIQSFLLRRQYQLDPKLMYELMETYGPFDWRCVEAHGIYWTILGTRRSPRWEINDELDRLNTERVLLYALRNLSRRGWLVFEPNPIDVNMSYFNQLPDLRFIDITHEMYIALGKRYNATPHWRAEGGGQYLGSGHQFFLHEAVRQLFYAGEEERAAKYYAYLRENFREPDGKIKPMYMRPLKEFVVGGLRENIDVFRGASDGINGLLFQAFLYLATGEGDQFVKGFNSAKGLWQSYMNERKNDENPRRQLPDFRRMARDQLAVFLRVPLVGMVGKSYLWERLPGQLEMKQGVWDEVAPTLESMCKRSVPPLNFKKAFPEPPGMAEYRKAHPSRPDTWMPEKKDRMVPVTQPAEGEKKPAA
ncbi:MAG: hypothetical protein JXQ73_22755 [Phycisphaerae bacterium]|nr:hypothetical protein [Phycisphaerae bacterium]